MRNIFLLALLLVSFFSIAQQQEGSYILTKEGEKIKIVPGEKISNNAHGSITYIYKMKYKKIDGDSAAFGRKSKSIKVKKIEKVIDGERLYVPVYNKNNKVEKLCRIIAYNDNYILGYYYLFNDMATPDGGVIKERERYVILDKEYKILSEKRIYDSGDKKNEESFVELKEKFGECLNRDDFYDKVLIKFIPLKFGRMKIEKGESLKFLHNVNQLDCKS